MLVLLALPLVASSQWECHSKHTTSNSMGLSDHDLDHIGDDITDCEARCTGSCKVVVWHASDRHCHVLSGSVSHDDYISSLQSSSDHTTCILIAPGPSPSPTPTPTPTPSGPSLSFLAIGDWGGSSDSHPTTAAQVANGRGMAKVGTALNASFVLAMGDNFYSSGIHGSSASSRFTATFEDAYPEAELEGVPWYVIAGNHDHMGNVKAQIDYSARSTRWNFPDYWYTFTKTAADGTTTQVVYIDTVTFSGIHYKHEETGELIHQPHTMQKLRGSQLQWLEATLAASTADYLWLSGHYPIYSQCQHGPTTELIDDVLPLMRTYKASGFLAGHDHCLGHYDGTGADAGMAFVLAGAGKECCYSPDHLNNAKNKGSLNFRMDGRQTHGAKGGFAALTATASSTTVSYYNTEGELLYTSQPVAPRRTSLVEAV